MAKKNSMRSMEHDLRSMFLFYTFFRNSFIYEVNCRFYSSCPTLPYGRDKESHILGSYLAGLFEGDGSIWIQKTIGTKKHNPRVCITFNSEPSALAENYLN